MVLEKAQCTNCSGILEVDASKEMATCQFCGTKYIVKDAIQNYHNRIYNTNLINNASFKMEFEFERLLKAANGYRKLRDYDSELATFEEITRKYPQKCVGWMGIVINEMKRLTGYETSCFAPEEYTSKALTNAMILADAQEKEMLSQAVATYKTEARKHNDRLKAAIEKFPDNKSLEDFFISNNCCFSGNGKVLGIRIYNEGQYSLEFHDDTFREVTYCTLTNAKLEVEKSDDDNYNVYDSSLTFLDVVGDNGLIPVLYKQNKPSRISQTFYMQMDKDNRNIRQEIERRKEETKKEREEERRKEYVKAQRKAFLWLALMLAIIVLIWFLH